MKQFVKALNKDGDCFEYLGEKFPAISAAKLKEGIFDGSQILTLFQDKNFTNHMDYTEKVAWQSFKNVSQKFLGNEKSDDYQNLVEDLLKNFPYLGSVRKNTQRNTPLPGSKKIFQNFYVLTKAIFRHFSRFFVIFSSFL